MDYTLVNEEDEAIKLYDIIDVFRALNDYGYKEGENRVMQCYTALNTGRRLFEVRE
ncbi:hypothetical protein JMUB7504_27510 [Staphylococcus aureus]